MNLQADYMYRSSESAPQNHLYAWNSAVCFDIKSHTYTNLYEKKYNYDYSSYYDWLNQHEQLVASCRLSANNEIFLTNKNITVRKGNAKRHFSLRQLEAITLTFRRLAFPLVMGGITAPLSALATANRIVDLVPGLLIVAVSTLLFYYGWAGSYQIHLDFKTHKITYFSDEEGEKLQFLVKKGNQMIRRRYALP